MESNQESPTSLDDPHGTPALRWRGFEVMADQAGRGRDRHGEEFKVAFRQGPGAVCDGDTTSDRATAEIHVPRFLRSVGIAGKADGRTGERCEVEGPERHDSRVHRARQSDDAVILTRCIAVGLAISRTYGPAVGFYATVGVRPVLAREDDDLFGELILRGKDHVGAREHVILSDEDAGAVGHAALRGPHDDPADRRERRQPCVLHSSEPHGGEAHGLGALGRHGRRRRGRNHDSGWWRRRVSQLPEINIHEFSPSSLATNEQQQMWLER